MRKEKDKVKIIAERRIKRLFELAKSEKRENLSKRYVKLARQIARKTQTQIPRNLKRSFCKKCDLLFTSKGVRTKNGFLIRTCFCGARRRFKIKTS